jgi:NAD+ synthase
MSFSAEPLQIDSEETGQSITSFIHSVFRSLKREVAIIGLSGGLDSSLVATLAVKSLGAEKVKLYYLPERDSKPLHQKHALLMAEKLGIELKSISITPALRALRVYSLLPLRYFPGYKLKARVVDIGQKILLKHRGGEILRTRFGGKGGAWIWKANAYISAKHRVRSIILFREAERLNGMVIGAANRTEWMTGTFTQFGCDHNADIMPILHLYRSQLESLAAHLELPEEIRSKSADPDVLPGLDNKGEFLGSFEIADQILWGIENGIAEEELSAKFGQEKVIYIKSLMEESAHYREAPYSLLDTLVSSVPIC